MWGMRSRPYLSVWVMKSTCTCVMCLCELWGVHVPVWCVCVRYEEYMYLCDVFVWGMRSTRRHKLSSEHGRRNKHVCPGEVWGVGLTYLWVMRSRYNYLCEEWGVSISCLLSEVWGVGLVCPCEVRKVGLTCLWEVRRVDWGHLLRLYTRRHKTIQWLLQWSVTS